MRLVTNRRLPEFYESFSYAAAAMGAAGKTLETAYDVACEPVYYMSPEAKAQLKERLSQFPTFGEKAQFENLCNVSTSWRSFTMGLVYPWSGEGWRIAKALPEPIMSGAGGELYNQGHIHCLISKLEKFMEGRFVFSNHLVQPMPFAGKIEAIRVFMEAQPCELIPMETASFREVDESEYDDLVGDLIPRHLWGKGPIDVKRELV